MYTVEWCGYDGNLEQIRISRLTDANLEAADLYEKYGWARILDKTGNPVKVYD